MLSETSIVTMRALYVHAVTEFLDDPGQPGFLYVNVPGLSATLDAMPAPYRPVGVPYEMLVSLGKELGIDFWDIAKGCTEYEIQRLKEYLKKEAADHSAID